MSETLSVCSSLQAEHWTLLPGRRRDTVTCIAALQVGHSNLTASRLPEPPELRGSDRLIDTMGGA
jgi:hypothetical protein